jgi:RHS repeat-associated protein
MITFHKIQHALLWLVLGCFLSISTAQAGSLTFTYYATDALGSPVVAMNQAGDVIWRKTYEPYGKASGADGDNRVGYTGHVEEQNGLVYAGARYYDPALGRFLSDDPVRFTESNPMSFNRYAYANNNPYKYVDPDGGKWGGRSSATH